MQEVQEIVKGRAQIIKIDTERNPRIAARYSVAGLPTLCIFRHGEVVQRFEGLRDKNELLLALASASDMPAASRHEASPLASPRTNAATA